MRKVINGRTYKSDLVTRERVNFTIDSEIMARLRKYSADTGIPMARILDKAILAALEKEASHETPKP